MSVVQTAVMQNDLRNDERYETDKITNPVRPKKMCNNYLGAAGASLETAGVAWQQNKGECIFIFQ